MLCFSYGIDVIQALERQPCEVILMDMQMPEMDGLEAMKKSVRPIQKRRNQTLLP